MKKTVTHFVAILIAIFLSGNAFSQNSFSIHAGPAFPLADFGEDDVSDEDAAGAAVGFNLGGKYLYSLNDKGLGLYLDAGFIFNGLKKSVKDDLEDALSDFIGADVDIAPYKYINIPITAGLNYTFKANEKMSLFGDLGIGFDFLKVTRMNIEVDGEEMEANYDLSTHLAFKLGGGLLIQDKYIVGLHYNGLGNHNVKGEMKYDGVTEDLEGSDLKVDILTLTFGIKF